MDIVVGGAQVLGAVVASPVLGDRYAFPVHEVDPQSALVLVSAGPETVDRTAMTAVATRP